MLTPSGATLDSALSAYRSWIGWSTSACAAKRRPGRPSKTRKIVVASDFHVPFHRKDVLAGLIEQEARDTDVLVIAGDLADMWATSRFRKSRKLTDPRRDFIEAQSVLNLLAERFRRIVLFEGNHDSRPMKMLADHLPAEVMDYLRLTAPGALHPLRLMAEKLPNVEVAEPIQHGYAAFGFLYQMGDAVFTHAEKFSRVPNRAVSGPVLQWLKSFAEPQGIVQPFRVVVQGHTHQAGTVHGDFGVLCIENGCMCDLQEYHADPKIMSPRPQAPGWTVLYQSGGVTDLRSSRFIPFK